MRDFNYVESQFKAATTPNEIRALRAQLVSEYPEMASEINNAAMVFRESLKRKAAVLADASSGRYKPLNLNVVTEVSLTTSVSLHEESNTLSVSKEVSGGAVVSANNFLGTPNYNHHNQYLKDCEPNTFLLTFAPNSSIGLFSVR